ncbi:MAG TPA: hypothetical protein VJY34_00700 [Roseiarcus sp.]|nr:hypothetical protein [Roseiarcus sp.]
MKLVFSEHYERIVDAIAAERRIKGWSRAKKEAYMRGDFPTLVSLSLRYYGDSCFNLPIALERRIFGFAPACRAS